MVHTYSEARDGLKPLTVNFKVREFACKDGSDSILIDDNLVTVLQHIRDALGKPVNLNSAYRTPAHNKAVGGAPNSFHMQGMAADIHVSGVDTVTVCKAAEKALKFVNIPGAIIRYHTKNNFVHVDVRTARLRQENDGTKAVHAAGWSGDTPASAFPTLRKGAKGEYVSAVQEMLNTLRGAGLTVDGDFGTKTELAVRAFQQAKGLAADGIVGGKTWAALEGAV